MYQNKLISICIPTFNRSKFLEKALYTWVMEIETNKLQKFIEIVVGDNNSSDDTQKTLSFFSKKHSYIRHFKNAKNLGFSGNIIKLALSVKGEYLWIISDDDYIYKNSLLKIVEIINNFIPSLIYINYDAKVLDKKKIIRNMLNVKMDYHFKNRRDFFKFFKSPDAVYRLRSTYLSFASLSIVKRDIFIRNYYKVKSNVNLIKELFPHTWILWYDLPENIYILKKPLFVQLFSHSGHSTHISGWFDTCIKFKNGLNPIYASIIKKYKNNSNSLFLFYLYGAILYSYLTIIISFIIMIKDKIKSRMLI